MSKATMIYGLVHAKHRRESKTTSSQAHDAAIEAVYNEGIIAGVRRAQSTANSLPTESHGVMRYPYIPLGEVQSMFLRILKELRG